MQASVQYMKSIAASGTDNVTLAIPSGCRSLAVKVAVNFGHSSSSGLSTVVTYSKDNGSTFGASNVAIPLITAAASGEYEYETVISLRDNPYMQDSGPATHYKLAFTNNDGTYAAQTLVLMEDQQKIG